MSFSKTTKNRIIFVIIILGIVIFDQITKSAAQNYFENSSDIFAPFIPGFMRLTYVHNTGMAFSFFSGATWLLAVFSAVMAVVVIFILFKYAPKFNSKLFDLSLCFLAGGALGNLIDRIFRGYVIDMMDFEFVDFAIFNVADCFVTFGAIFLAVFVIWFWDRAAKDKNE